MADFDRYIATLFSPAASRAALTAIWAFHCEMARVIEQAKQPLMGEIRLRWWCDALEEIDNQPAKNAMQNPLLFALQQAILQFDLSKEILISSCEARMNLLYDRPFPDSQKFELYGHETAGAFFQLAYQILEKSPKKARHFSSERYIKNKKIDRLSEISSKAETASLPFIESREKKTEMANLACFHAGQIDTLWRHWHWQKNQGINIEAGSEIIASLRRHYGLFIREIIALPRTVRLAFLPLAPIRYYLRLTRAGGIMIPKISFLRHFWQIGYTASTGHFSSL